MSNYLIRALAYGQQARIFFVNNTDMMRTICYQSGINHKLLQNALGSTLSIASLLVGTLKDGQRLSLRMRTSHPAQCIYADVDSEGNVRGYLSDELAKASEESLKGMSLQDLIGEKGSIQVVKDIGMNRNITSITNMPHRNIVDDMSYYFEQSEQTSTRFAFDIVFDANEEILRSSSIMAQILPNAQSSVMESIQETLEQWSSFVSTIVEDDFLKLPSLLFPDIEIKAVEPIQAFCGCSKEMMLPMLHSLGFDELANSVEQEETIEMFCRICGQSYQFLPTEVGKLLLQYGH